MKTMPDPGAAITVAGFRVTLLALALLTLAGCAGPLNSKGDGAMEAEQQGLVMPAPTEPLTAKEELELAQAREAALAEDWTTAELALTRLASSRTDLAWIKARLAWVYQQQGDDGQARALYRDAVEMNPADALTVNNLALMLQRDGQFTEARALLEQGLAYSPNVPQLHYNLAVLSELYLLDLESALAHYRRYQQLVGEDDSRVTGWIADLERRVE